MTSPLGNSKPIKATDPVTPTAELTPGTVVVSQPAIDELISEQDGTLTFPTAPPAEIANLAPGQTFVAPPTAAAPEGILGTVQSISAGASGHYLVDTVPASLRAAFRTMSYSVAGVPPAPPGPLLPGPMLQASAPGITQGNRLGNDGDPTVNLLGGRDGLSGIMSFDITPHASASFHCHGFACLSPRIHADVGATATMHTQLTGSIRGSTSIPLGTFHFGCIYFTVIAIPVAICSSAELSLDISVSASVTIGADAARQHWRVNRLRLQVGLFGAGDAFGERSHGCTGCHDHRDRRDSVRTQALDLHVRRDLRRPGDRRRPHRNDQLPAQPADESLLQTLPIHCAQTETLSPPFLVEPESSVRPPQGNLRLPHGQRCASGSRALHHKIRTFRSLERRRSPWPALMRRAVTLTWRLIGAFLFDSISSSGVFHAGPFGGGRTLTVEATDTLSGLAAATTVTVGVSNVFDPPSNLTFTREGSGERVPWDRADPHGRIPNRRIPCDTAIPHDERV